jgi:death-on-curing protein
MIYITLMEAIQIHEAIMTRFAAHSELLDEGKLDSALMRAANAAHYEEADLFEQAATLVAGVALAHAFADGNKRLAATLGLTFLFANGVPFESDPIEFAEQVLALVNRAEPLAAATTHFAQWLRMHSKLRT